MMTPTDKQDVEENHGELDADKGNRNHLTQQPDVENQTTEWLTLRIPESLAK